MDRSEQTGVGVALAGHIGLFAVLSVGLLNQPIIKPPPPAPVEVELVGEVALESAAPTPMPTQSEPAPSIPVDPFDPAPAPPPTLAPAPPPLPVPAPAEPAPQAPVSAARKGLRPANPEPAARPRPAEPARAATKPAPVRTAAVDPRDRRRPDRGLGGMVSQYRNPSAAAASPAAKPSAAQPSSPRPAIARPSPSASAGASATKMSSIQKVSLFAVINSQLRPHWKPPSGADAELLVTRLSVRLNADGSLAGSPEVEGQDGVTDSNRAQAALHAQRAIDAVRRAAPFKNLPPQFYESWKWLKPLRFDGKLAR